jgi:hypothetical protein
MEIRTTAYLFKKIEKNNAIMDEKIIVKAGLVLMHFLTIYPQSNSVTLFVV